MRKKTLRAELERVNRDIRAHLDDQTLRAEIITVVEVRDFPQIQKHFDRSRVIIDTQRAEIALLRMLLKQALSMLERLHLTNKTIAPDFNKLARRANDVLDKTTLTKDDSDE